MKADWLHAVVNEMRRNIDQSKGEEIESINLTNVRYEIGQNASQRNDDNGMMRDNCMAFPVEFSAKEKKDE